MQHRSTEATQHRSTLIITRQTVHEYRPTPSTTYRSTIESTMRKRETTQLAVGKMIAIRRAIQSKPHYMVHMHTSIMKVALRKKSSNIHSVYFVQKTRQEQKLIHFLQWLMEKELVRVISTQETSAHRSTIDIHHRSTIISHHDPR